MATGGLALGGDAGDGGEDEADESPARQGERDSCWLPSLARPRDDTMSPRLVAAGVSGGDSPAVACAGALRGSWEEARGAWPTIRPVR